MRRILLRPRFSFFATRRCFLGPYCLYNNGGPTPNASNSEPTWSFDSNPRWVFTNSLPPPEWVELLNDVSELVSSARDLNLSPWVPQILNIFTGDSSNNLEANLDTFCKTFFIKLSPNFVSFVLNSDELLRKPNIALHFFYWATKQKKYDHKLECYVSLIDVLSLCGDLDCTRRVFSELNGMGFLMNAASVNSLIKSFGNVGMVEELLWVWHQMKENVIEPSLYTYNFLMNGLVSSMFIESAEQVFEVMENGKVEPDVVTYNTLIEGYCKAGNVQKAFKKFRAMEVRNLQPDKITYMTSIQMCYSKEDFDSCLSLYNEMEEMALEIPPYAYTLVIGGLCKQGKCMEGCAVKGCKANVAIYTAMITSYSKCGGMEDAVRLFKMMENDGFEPDEVTYEAIINGLCRSG